MNNRVINWFKFSSPQTFYPLAGKLIPWFWALTAAFGLAGLYVGFFVAPTDAQQGEGYRIIFIHVPASWMSMFLYLVMAFWAALGLGFNTRLSGMMASALAPTGALMAFLSLWTGALWGKPMWGTWWTWDARLTAELVLLFLYLGVIGLYHAIEDRRQAARAAGFLALVGVVNVPIVHFSVKWWNTLHQGSTVRLLGPSAIDSSMLWPLLVMALATKLWFFASLFVRARNDLVELEAGKDWARKVALGEGDGA